MTTTSETANDQVKVLARELATKLQLDYTQVQDLEYAMSDAMSIGYYQARAEHRVIEEAIEEKYRESEGHMIGATIAAVMDAAGVGQVTLHSDRVATIWADHELNSHYDDDHSTITYELAKRRDPIELN